MLGVRCLGGRFAVIGGRRAEGNFLIRFQHRAFVIQPRHGVGVHGCGECRRICSVAGHSGNSRTPPGKGVGVLDIRCFDRRFAVIGVCRAVCNFSIGFQHRAVVIQPRHRVSVHRRSEGCRVGHVTRQGSNRRTPPGKGIRILGVRNLRRCCAVVGGCGAVCNCLVGLQHRAVVVQPSHRVGVHGCGECRRICSVAGHSGNSRTPPGECVGVLGVRCLGRRFAVIGRRCAVCN